MQPLTVCSPLSNYVQSKALQPQKPAYMCLCVSHSLRSPHLMSTVSSSESLGTSRVPLFWAVGDATILQVR